MRVAVTGGIGEGKSAVLRMIADLGRSTASADDIARAIFSTPEVQARLAAATGLASPVSPGDLRQAITRSSRVRREVNRITHPLIYAGITRLQAEFVEVPLLVETCLLSEFDAVWVVTCGAREQWRRLMERYEDAAAVRGLLASQLPSRVKTAFADRVIRTNRPLGHVSEVVSEAVSGIRL